MADTTEELIAALRGTPEFTGTLLPGMWADGGRTVDALAEMIWTLLLDIWDVQDGLPAPISAIVDTGRSDEVDWDRVAAAFLPA